MAVINLTDKWPGMTSILFMRPDIDKALCEWCHLVLCGPDEAQNPEPAKSALGELTLTPAERELLGTLVSKRNNCCFCQRSHEIVARHLGSDEQVTAALENFEASNLPERLKSLLAIAAFVQANVKVLPVDMVTRAKKAGATEADIYDTVLIAASFSMFNRMVECLGTPVFEKEHPYYMGMAKRVERRGYRRDRAMLARKSTEPQD